VVHYQLCPWSMAIPVFTFDTTMISANTYFNCIIILLYLSQYRRAWRIILYKCKVRNRHAAWMLFAIIFYCFWFFTEKHTKTLTLYVSDIICILFNNWQRKLLGRFVDSRVIHIIKYIQHKILYQLAAAYPKKTTTINPPFSAPSSRTHFSPLYLLSYVDGDT